MKFLRVNGARASSAGGRQAGLAFTLIEVMIALVIFFMATFSILALVSTVLKNARILQNKKGVDGGMVAARIYPTNRLADGSDSGDFGDLYRGYSWITEIGPAPGSTNSLKQVDIVVQHEPGGRIESQMSILVFAPDSQANTPGGMRR